MNIIPLNSPTLPVLIPPAYGLQGVGFETYTGDGSISYWNSDVGVSQMGGQGNFSDTRIGLTITQKQDRVTPKLPALLEYQLSLAAPLPPSGSFNRTAPLRGIWQHPPYFHDGSAATLVAVVNHYDQRFNLKLSAQQKADLLEFLKSF